MRTSTKTVQIGVGKDPTGSISFPVYQNATFRHPGFGESTGYDYSRSGNPTRQVLEDGIADLDAGCRGFAYTTGLAALTSILMLFKPGEHLVVTEDLYGGTYRLLDKVFAQYGLETTYIDTSNTEAISGAIKPSTKAILVETPTNPLLKVANVSAISEIAKKQGIILIVDNTFMTPYLQQPLELGADITVYSGTKFLAGHNDLLAGLVVAKDESLAEKIYFLQNSVGAVLGPQDSWLLVRGMKTLAIRMERQEQNALKLAQWLSGHKAVTKVYYPGLEKHPGHSVQKRQATGFGGMLSLEVLSQNLAKQVLNRVKLISFAESLGGVETLITFPSFQTHTDMDPVERERMGINDRLLRLSVGIEDINDLIEDLEQALSEEA